jgi:hypothetical protein
MNALNSLWLWFSRLFERKKSGAGARNAAWPTSEQIALLPWFDSLRLDDIIVIETEAGAHRAYSEIAREAIVGFDTESKPTFVRGEVSEGPHVAQFSTCERAYVFSLHDAGVRKVVGTLMELATLKKVGFGLGDDLRRIRKKLRVEPKAVVDVGTLFGRHGYGREVGVKVAVALVFKSRFRKSKRAATSNWKNRHLTDQQVLYAANDAYAALRVCLALEKTPGK